MNNIIIKKLLVFTIVFIFFACSLTPAVSEKILNNNKKDSIENRDQQLDKKREDYEPKPLDNGGSWWNTSWLYRKQCNISNNIDDYQTKIIVGNNSGGDIYCNGHCKSDFSDLRFINDDGFCLPYWIKEFTIDNNATIWIKNEYNDSSFYVYYGNSDASDLSNGTETFVYFEDFESYAEDEDPDGKNNWTTNQGSAGSYVKVVTYNGSKVLKINDDGVNPSAYFNFSDQDDIRFYWDVLTNTQNSATNGFDVYDDREGAGGLLFSGMFRYQNNQYVWLPGNKNFNPGKGYSTNTWYRDWENQLVTTGDYDWKIIDNGTLHDGNGGQFGDYYVDGLDEISFGEARDNWWVIDNLYIACYTNGSEPSFSFGNEENQSSDFESPVISDIDYSISDPIDTNPSFGWENITCTVTDDNEVNEVNLTITYPDSHTENISMIHAGGGVYYHNTTFSSVGTYSYFIWANDTSGNINMSTVIFSFKT